MRWGSSQEANGGSSSKMTYTISWPTAITTSVAQRERGCIGRDEECWRCNKKGGEGSCALEKVPPNTNAGAQMRNQRDRR